jgi:peptidoglycan/xylan/chitin deacetylase (PgdA/CDA1 family)
MTTAPAFLITVDTEGDNIWAKPRAVTTRNAEYLPRFQELCEKYGLRPTYLVNWEMANAPAFREFGRAVLARGTGEIGMHLHAWDSPPVTPLTDDDVQYAPYLIEYPEARIREKVKVMTDTLEGVFGVKMRSHRSGRWAFNETYARILVEHGYQVDCSVTPHVSWKFCAGDPAGSGGTDYTDFPETAYFVDLTDIRRPGDSPLLELPVTIVRTRRYARALEAVRAGVARSFYGTLVLRKLFPYYLWLMPTGRNGDDLRRVLAVARREGRPYVEMALHSSELMPGGSPKLPDPPSIDRLYADLEALFAAATDTFRGCTLSEYHDRIRGAGTAAPAATGAPEGSR